MRVDNLKVEELIDLRDKVESELSKRAQGIEHLLTALGKSPVSRRGNGSSLKGIKIKPKYRGPNGETWAGRGETPKWLKALVKKGRKIESYRIKQAA